MMAILFGASAPALSHAIAASQGTLWTEICSAAGIKLVPIAIDQGTGADGPLQMDLAPDHCAFCSLQAESFDLIPAAPASFLALPVVRDGYPPLYFQSPRPLVAWVMAQPRAPPAFS
jgi:hypothetical protein